MEYKTIHDIEIKADAAEGIVTAYASVFSNTDSYGDRMIPGAFTKTLSENARRVRVLRDHDPRLVVGTPQHMEQDRQGLLTVTKMSGTPLGREMLTLLQEGAYNELSVGFNTVKSIDNDAKGRDLLEVRLFEYSYVLWGANDLAQVTEVKTAADLEREIKKWEAIAALDLKAGKVLSKDNAQRIINALKNLQDVISAAGLEEAAAGTSEDTTAQKSSTEPPRHSLLTALQLEAKRLDSEGKKSSLLTDLRQFSTHLYGRNT